MSRNRFVAPRRLPSVRPAAPATRVLSVLLLALALLLPAAPAHAAGNQLTLVKTAGEGDTPGLPLAGIDFQLNQVLDVDATSPEQLQALVAEQPGILTSDPGHPLGPDVLVTSDADGRATATGLPDGVYLVRELPSRVGDVSWSVASPFLVALPTADGDSSPEVRLKDQPVGLDIAIAPATVSPGDVAEVTVTGSAPAPDVRGELHRYTLVVRPDRRLQVVDPAGTTVAMASVPTPSAVTSAPPVLPLPAGEPRRMEVVTSSGSVVLAPGVEWTSRVDTTTNALVASLTPTGLQTLARLRAGHPETRVVLRFDTLVSAQAGEGLLQVLGNLFTDGWPVPADLSLVAADGAATSLATLRVVVTDCTGCQPSATPTTTVPGDAGAPGAPVAAPGAPSTARPGARDAGRPAAATEPTVEQAAPAVRRGLLASTGAPVTLALVLLGAGLVLTGLWTLLAVRRGEGRA